MNCIFQIASVSTALWFAACATNEPAARPDAPPPTSAATAPASSRQALPSLKETARLEKEIGAGVTPYPFATCAVIQKPFDADGPKHRRIYKGHEVLFCCTPCLRAFDTNPDPYMPRIVAAAAAKASASNVTTVPAAQ